MGVGEKGLNINMQDTFIYAQACKKERETGKIAVGELPTGGSAATFSPCGTCAEATADRSL